MGIDWSEFAGGDDSGEDAPKWRWEQVGDVLEGEVTRLEVAESAYGRCPVATVRTADGPRTVWVSQANLRRGMAAAAVAVGDMIRVSWVDEVDTGKGNPLKVFEVKRKRAGGAPAAAPAPAPVPAAAEDDGWS